ncbi:head decoration protein [Achromobacter sp. ACM03]|jgi:hypothetical protein|uniref:Head decoration protein n=2 Tax=Achromobacter TaxID=222 RepID=A0A424W4Q8_ALCXX|nr:MULTISPECIES: head decoration protein [Achromobacter]MBC9908527.1 head decoration protein [Achromobacter xylosoxidans]MBD0872446.1 head decoration protein [Achromobacter xylosoxidans]MBD9432681.1 head decoration protein [Achromobacter sp. ACM03]MBD9476186.1 head decoration protein [Achromobacter sp. ACM01]QNP87649.1 head decoration protein [Achromobacter xylosoxidans]
MPFIHQQARTADFILSEANGQRSRENAILAATLVALAAGQLLTLGDDGKYAAYAGPGADPGAPITADAVLYGNAPVSDDDQQIVVIARDAELAGVLLVGLDAPARVALQSAGIIVR